MLVIKKIWLVVLLIIALISPSILGQDWGRMIDISWFNPPPLVYPGFFNPSYCDAESLLYFDSYFRLIPTESKIYSTTYQGRYGGQWYWSDVVEIPAPINIPGYFSLTPDINAGGDSMYFSSDRPGTRGGLDLWLSVRINSVWGEPINLGDSLNTEADELSPYHAGQSGILFFERYLNDSPEYDPNKILMSQLTDGIWQSPELLPRIINADNCWTYGPYFDEVEQELYFTNIDPWVINQLKKSKYVDSEWQEPVPLSGGVNGFWSPNYCNLVTTENACMSFDRNLLFYNKWIWEVEYCIDFASILFVSERLVGIDESHHKPLNYDLSLSNYPNPFNSTTIISYSNLGSNDIEIYDITGRLAKTLYADDADDGRVIWDATDESGRGVCSGIYFARVSGKNGTAVTKMIYLK